MSVFGEKKSIYLFHFVKAAFEIPGYNMVNSWKDSSDRKYLKKKITKEDNMSLMTIH